MVCLREQVSLASIHARDLHRECLLQARIIRIRAKVSVTIFTQRRSIYNFKTVFEIFLIVIGSLFTISKYWFCQIEKDRLAKKAGKIGSKHQNQND